jgi:hypothetical protein
LVNNVTCYGCKVDVLLQHLIIKYLHYVIANIGESGFSFFSQMRLSYNQKCFQCWLFKYVQRWGWVICSTKVGNMFNKGG